MTLQSRIEEIVDKHLAHRNPADLQCREQLVQSLLGTLFKVYPVLSGFDWNNISGNQGYLRVYNNLIKEFDIEVGDLVIVVETEESLGAIVSVESFGRVYPEYTLVNFRLLGTGS